MDEEKTIMRNFPMNAVRLCIDHYEDDIQGRLYNKMSPKELFNLCKERGIEAKPKKTSAYYINLLEESDEEDEWDDEDDE